MTLWKKRFSFTSVEKVVRGPESIEPVAALAPAGRRPLPTCGSPLAALRIPRAEPGAGTCRRGRRLRTRGPWRRASGSTRRVPRSEERAAPLAPAYGSSRARVQAPLPSAAGRARDARRRSRRESTSHAPSLALRETGAWPSARMLPTEASIQYAKCIFTSSPTTWGGGLAGPGLAPGEGGRPDRQDVRRLLTVGAEYPDLHARRDGQPLPVRRPGEAVLGRRLDDDPARSRSTRTICLPAPRYATATSRPVGSNSTRSPRRPVPAGSVSSGSRTARWSRSSRQSWSKRRGRRPLSKRTVTTAKRPSALMSYPTRSRGPSLSAGNARVSSSSSSATSPSRRSVAVKSSAGLVRHRPVWDDLRPAALDAATGVGLDREQDGLALRGAPSKVLAVLRPRGLAANDSELPDQLGPLTQAEETDPASLKAQGRSERDRGEVSPGAEPTARTALPVRPGRPSGCRN